MERQADKDLLHGLLQGEFCYVLTFCLLGVASAGDLIRDTRITPPNLGHPNLGLRDALMNCASSYR